MGDEKPDKRFICVCDSSVLNRLFADVPQFHKHLRIHVPDSMVKSREMRTNRTFIKHIKEGNIIVEALCHQDFDEIYKMIKETLGPSVAEAYRRKSKGKNIIEYNCMYLAKKYGCTLFIFDDKGQELAKKVIKKKGRVENITELVDYMSISKENKISFLSNLAKMNYKLAKDKLAQITK